MRVTYIRMVVLFLVCVFCFSSLAKSSRSLTLEDAIELALSLNPSILRAIEEVKIAQANRHQASLPHNPEVSASLMFEKNGSSESFPRVGVSQDIWSIYLSTLQRRAANSEVKASELMAAYETTRVVSEVKKAYYKVQALEQFKKFLNDSTQAAHTAAALSQKQFEAGNINILESNAQRLMAEQAQLELIRSEGDLKFAKGQLAQLLGEPQNAEQFKLLSHLPSLPKSDPDVSRIVPMALSQRADLLAENQKQKGLEKEKNLANWKTLPSLKAGFDVEQDPDRTWFIGPQMGLEVPLFNRGQAERKRIKTQQTLNRISISELESTIRTQVAEQLTMLTQARQLALRYRDHVFPLLDSSLDETQKQYNLMLKGVYDLLQVKREQIQAQREYAQALADYWMAYAELEAVVGGSLGGKK